MTGKNGNRLFMAIVLVDYLVCLLLWRFQSSLQIGIAWNLFLSEMVLIVPAFVMLGITKTPLRVAFPIRKIKISSALMVILFTYLMLPLTTVINAVTALFTENAALEISGDVLDMPFFLMFLLMAVYGPICEEFVFRGVMYQSHKNSGTAFGAFIVSACMFGLIHMNWNQACYALVVGLALVLLREATGSMIAPVLFHIVFNAQSVCMLYLSDHFMPGILEQASDESMLFSDIEQIIIVISVYSVIALVTTSIAICVLVWIAKNENRMRELRNLFESRKMKPGRIITIPLILGIVGCVISMIMD